MMETIMVFLMANIWSVGVVVVFVVAGILLIKLGFEKNVAMVAYMMVCKVEDDFGKGTGTIKFAVVVDYVYTVLPNIVRFFLTKDEIDNIIELAVLKMKEYLKSKSE